MAITNKTLSVLLIAAIVVSIGGTFFSLTMLQAPTGAPTGYAIGTVDLDVPDTLSIKLDDDTINFGECTPSTGGDTIFVDSSQDSAAVNNSNCTESSGFPDSMTIRNNGNVDASVAIQSNADAGDLFGDASLNGFAYKAGNDGAGCAGTLSDTYKNFSDISGNDTACDNLQAHSTNHSMELYAAAWLHPTATGGGSADWTIEATAS